MLNSLPNGLQYQQESPHIQVGMVSAMLYLFSPSTLPSQVVRPYSFEITPAVAGDLHATYMDSQSGNRCTQLTEALASAVRPSAQAAFGLDTSIVSNNWTFILIVTVPSSAVYTGAGMGDRCGAASTRTTISTGYCCDIPIDPITNSINHNCPLVFTSTITSGERVFNNRKDNRGYINARDTIVHDQYRHMVGSDNDIYSASPNDMFTYTADNSVSLIRSCLLNSHDNTPTEFEQKSRVPSRITMNMMNSILGSHQNAVANTQAMISPGYTEPLGYDECYNVDMQSNLLKSAQNSIHQGFDTSRPTSLQVLMYAYPDLEIHPFNIPMSTQWDVADQRYTNINTLMAYTASQALPALATESGIVNITFAYCSWSNEVLFGDITKGEWRIDKLGLISENTNLASAIALFKRRYMATLHPTLMTYNGEYMIYASIDIVGDVAVNIQSLDNHDQYGHESGFFTTSARLGGMMNPMVANYDLLVSNANQLKALSDEFVHKFGPKQDNHNFEPVYASDIPQQPFEERVNMTPFEQYTGVL